MTSTLTRRSFLARSAVLGCSAAASPLLTPVVFASAPWDNRLVVIILRGGMDGLDVVQPYGDPDFAGLRRSLKFDDGAARDLDGFFALHPALGDLHPLWGQGELGFVQAVSTPYRDKRSHFDGQDLLEAGTIDLAGVRDGWLNRMLQAVPGIEAETAYAIGREKMRLLAGPAPVAEWSPEAVLALSEQALELVRQVMADDPLMHAAVSEAIDLSGAEQIAMTMDAGEMNDLMQNASAQVRRGNGHVRIAEFAAEKLRADSRVAAFSLNGWGTHANQAQTLGGPLGQLAQAILALKSGLGPVWDKTAVIAMTEFGRTARENGTRRTDHGTAGVAVLAGGAIRGGRVFGNWPGLAEADLYQGRDLMPTTDVRAVAGWMMRGHFGLGTGTIEGSVFPGVEMGSDPGVIL